MLWFAIACAIAMTPVVKQKNAPGSPRTAPSFTTEIVPLMTRLGCNAGACHGKGAGQNGFRLSLRGFAPEQDYRSLTREFAGRRLDPASPAESLLLRKATARTPHEGGRLIAPSSREYDLLLAWLAAGFPGPDPREPRIKSLIVTPDTGVLKPGEEAPLRATATFADGTTRDVTWLTRFESNDPAHLAVSPSGRVRALRNGAGAVRAMFLTEVAVAVYAMPFDRGVDERGSVRPTTSSTSTSSRSSRNCGSSPPTSRAMRSSFAGSTSTRRVSCPRPKK